MMSKNFVIKKIKKSNEPKLYIFYNLTKNQGIKRMRPKSGESNIQIGEIVKMDGETYILLQIFDRPNGQMILYTGELGE
jgi:hypothetical protein